MEISHLISFPLKDGSLRGFMTDTSCNKLELQPKIEILLQEQTPFLYVPMKAKFKVIENGYIWHTVKEKRSFL